MWNHSAIIRDSAWAPTHVLCLDIWSSQNLSAISVTMLYIIESLNPDDLWKQTFLRGVVVRVCHSGRPFVCGQSWMQSEFKANLDYKMRCQIKKTQQNWTFFFFTATVWVGLRGSDLNSGLVWVDSLCFSSGTGSYLGQVSHTTSRRSSRKNRWELLKTLKISAQNRLLPSPSKSHKWRGGDILVGCTKCWGHIFLLHREWK